MIFSNTYFMEETMRRSGHQPGIFLNDQMKQQQHTSKSTHFSYSLYITLRKKLFVLLNGNLHFLLEKLP